MISSPNSTILREIITGAPIEGKDCKTIKKSSLLFGDTIKKSNDCSFDGYYKCLHQIRDRCLFFPNTERYNSFSYFQQVSTPKKIYWAQDGVLLCNFGYHGDFPIWTNKHVSELFSGLWKEYPLSKTLLKETQSIHCCQRRFSFTKFQTFGWVYSF